MIVINLRLPRCPSYRLDKLRIFSTSQSKSTRFFCFVLFCFVLFSSGLCFVLFCFVVAVITELGQLSLSLVSLPPFNASLSLSYHLLSGLESLEPHTTIIGFVSCRLPRRRTISQGFGQISSVRVLARLDQGQFQALHSNTTHPFVTIEPDVRRRLYDNPKNVHSEKEGSWQQKTMTFVRRINYPKDKNVLKTSKNTTT